jgi:tartrate dehydrogenase/decarboxylase/D-malate dehydrogenase
MPERPRLPTKYNSPSMFGPIHGAAFDVTGKGIANPVGALWTAALMLEYLREKGAAQRLMQAVERVTASGKSNDTRSH